MKKNNDKLKLFLVRKYREKYPTTQGRETTDALICHIMGKDALPVTRDSGGKPAVNIENIFISVSHSEDTFALLVADINVGIDIQYRRKVVRDRIADRYFTDSEKAFVREKGEDGFFTLWTMKEAFAKYTGKGMKQILDRTEVIGRNDVEFREIKLEDNLFCSICCEAGKGEEIEVNVLD